MKKGYRKYVVLFGMMLISCSMCVSLYVGNISTYIYSIHYTRGDLDAFDIDVTWLLPVYLVFKIVGTLIVDRTSKRFGLKLTFCAGMILSWSSVFFTYFTVSHSVWATTMTLTLIGGIGNSILYMCDFLYVAGWFDEGVGLATAMLYCSSAIGGVIVNQIITAYINPDNLSPDATIGEISYFSQPEVLDRIPMIFVVIGFLTFGLQLSGFCLLREPPSRIESEEESNLLASKSADKDAGFSDHDNRVNVYPSDKDRFQKGQNGTLALMGNSFDSRIISLSIREENVHHGNGTGPESRPEVALSLTPLQVLKSGTYYYLECALFAQSLGLLVAENYFKVFGQLWIKDDQFLAFVGSTMSFCVVLSMPPCGYLLDKFGVKVTLTGHLATSTVFFCFWYFVADPSKWLYLLWVVVVFASNINQFVLYPMASLRIFGPAYYAANFAILQIATMVVCFIGPPLMTTILSSLGWFWLFFIIAAMTFASLILIIVKMPAK